MPEPQHTHLSLYSGYRKGNHDKEPYKRRSLQALLSLVKDIENETTISLAGGLLELFTA